MKVCFLTKKLDSLKKSAENSQKLLNFEKPKPRFGSVLKAKSSAWLCMPFLKKARLGSPKGRLGLIINRNALYVEFYLKYYEITQL